MLIHVNVRTYSVAFGLRVSVSVSLSASARTFVLSCAVCSVHCICSVISIVIGQSRRYKWNGFAILKTCNLWMKFYIANTLAHCMFLLSFYCILFSNVCVCVRAHFFVNDILPHRKYCECIIKIECEICFDSSNSMFKLMRSCLFGIFFHIVSFGPLSLGHTCTHIYATQLQWVFDVVLYYVLSASLLACPSVFLLSSSVLQSLSFAFAIYLFIRILFCFKLTWSSCSISQFKDKQMICVRLYGCFVLRWFCCVGYYWWKFDQQMHWKCFRTFALNQNWQFFFIFVVIILLVPSSLLWCACIWLRHKIKTSCACVSMMISRLLTMVIEGI